MSQPPWIAILGVLLMAPLAVAQSNPDNAGSSSPSKTLQPLSAFADITDDTQRARALFACGEFYRDRRAIQQEHRQRLIEGLDGTASVIDLPFLFGEEFAGKELDLLADAIEDTMSQTPAASQP